MYKYLILISTVIFFSCNKSQTSSPIGLSAIVTLPLSYNSTKIVDIDSTFVTKFNSKSLNTIYQSSNYKSVWGTLQRRNIILNELVNSYNEGLNPTDYNVTKLTEYEKNVKNLSDSIFAEYDVMLTYNFQKYVNHIKNGRLNPKKLYEDWDLIQNNKVDLDELTSMSSAAMLEEKIEEIKSKNPVYSSLKKALVIINSLPEDNFEKITNVKKIIPNESNPALIDIKKRLIFWKDLKATENITTLYDSATVLAVKKFQSRHGLIADGIIGAGTIKSLNFSKNDRRNQILVNLERWKWYPTNMGDEYIIVNIPDYNLHLIKNQDTISTHKVVVGTNKRRTPILSSVINQVVYNPTWTVPPTILKEDVIPALTKNRAYLTNKNISLINRDGDTISPSQWEHANARNYRYVQSPGYDNSLGLVKMSFPNRFSVFIHDTNHRELFDRNKRSLSSGCVRVEDPIALSEEILSASENWDMDKINETLENRKTKYVSVKNKINFQLLYWTAWSKNGQLVFRDDIYDLDQDLYNKLYK